MPSLAGPTVARWQVLGQSPANGAANGFAHPATRHTVAYAVEDESVRAVVGRACTLRSLRARVTTAMAVGTELRLDVSVNGVNTTGPLFTDADGAGASRSSTLNLAVSDGDRIGMVLVTVAGAPVNTLQWALDMSTP